jgi:hypothetical protein
MTDFNMRGKVCHNTILTNRLIGNGQLQVMRVFQRTPDAFLGGSPTKRDGLIPS